MVLKFTGKNWFVISVIIFRYITKEIFSTLLAVTFILLLIFLSHEFVRYLGLAASGKIASHILLKVMGFEIPYLLALLLPLGLYLGIILGFGRLYVDSEMSILHASGVGIKRLLSITCFLAFIVMVVVLVLMLWVNPYIVSKKSEVMMQGLRHDNLLDTLQAGRFQVTNAGTRVIYVEHMTRDRKQANNIFMADRKRNTPHDHPEWIVLSAANGYQKNETSSRERFIVAKEGNRYEGIPGQNNYKMMQFKKYTVRVPTVVDDKWHEQQAMSSLVLWHQYAEAENAAELQWRLSIALSALILGLLALPLSYLKPRQGRYSQIIPALLIYIVYVNLLFVGRAWVEEEIIPIKLGIWWVHILFFILALILLFLYSRQSWSRQTR